MDVAQLRFALGKPDQPAGIWLVPGGPDGRPVAALHPTEPLTQRDIDILNGLNAEPDISRWRSFLLDVQIRIREGVTSLGCRTRNPG